MHAAQPVTCGERCRAGGTPAGWPTSWLCRRGAATGGRLRCPAPAALKAILPVAEAFRSFTPSAKVLHGWQVPVGRGGGRRGAAAAAAIAPPPGQGPEGSSPDPHDNTAAPVAIPSTPETASSSNNNSSKSHGPSPTPTAHPAPETTAAAAVPSMSPALPEPAPPPLERLDLASARHFVNLTNGIEALPLLQQLGLSYSFVRIQSTACEQQNLELLMTELDANLLTHLALGHTCIVYDCGSRRRDGTPRALWYGLEFVRYCLTQLWKLPPCPALLRGRNVSRTFDGHIRSFKQSTVKRLKYYAKYLPPASPADTGAAPASSSSSSPTRPPLRLYGAYRATDHDDDVPYYVALLHAAELQPRQQQQQQQQQGWQKAAHAGAPGAASISSSGSISGSSGSGGSGGDGASMAEGLLQGGTQAGTQGGTQGGHQGPDGEAVLAAHGYLLFRRGVSPAEWAAAAAAAAAAGGGRDGDGGDCDGGGTGGCGGGGGVLMSADGDCAAA